jgi:hypothetical protein
MPSKSYALDKGGPKRVNISWTQGWGETYIYLDGEMICHIESIDVLCNGLEIPLTGGSILTVRLVKKIPVSVLQVFFDGKALPGSSSDPELRLKLAYGTIFFLGLINLFFGTISININSTVLNVSGISSFSILYGLVFLVSGYLVRERSLIALYIAIGVLIFDTITGAAVEIVEGHGLGMSGIRDLDRYSK